MPKDHTEPSSNALTRWLLPVVSTVLWGYLVSVLFSGSRIAGIRVTAAILFGVITVGAAVSSVLAGRFSEERRRDLLALCLSLLVAFVGIDTAYAIWANLRTERRSEQADERLIDPNVWHGELFPRSYYPTDRAFTLYKPNVRVEAVVYGEFYERRMLESPTLVRDALRLRPLAYTIDANGLRNRIPIGQSQLWALGDSYAMGYSTSEGRTWTDRFGELTGRSIYNIGISATSPGVQVQVLEHLLRKGKDGARPARVLWMLFEGNDLENSYAEHRPLTQARRGLRASLEDTIVGDLLSLPSTIRRRSVIGRLFEGEFHLAQPPATSRTDPYQIDGVRLATPVFRSERWGYCMFNPAQIEAAQQGEDYVLSHPNRPRLDKSFDRMKSLAEEFGFEVTVTVAPSPPRAVAHDFPEMPQPTPIPYFIRYVEGLTKRHEFEWIDLLDTVSSDRSGQMLYYCDDHHWNERGNDVVARFLADRL